MSNFIGIRQPVIDAYFHPKSPEFLAKHATTIFGSVSRFVELVTANLDSLRVAGKFEGDFTITFSIEGSGLEVVSRVVDLWEHSKLTTTHLDQLRHRPIQIERLNNLNEEELPQQVHFVSVTLCSRELLSKDTPKAHPQSPFCWEIVQIVGAPTEETIPETPGTLAMSAHTYTYHEEFVAELQRSIKFWGNHGVVAPPTDTQFT